MALILLVQVQSRVFTAKCSEPQVGISNGSDNLTEFQYVVENDEWIVVKK